MHLSLVSGTSKTNKINATIYVTSSGKTRFMKERIVLSQISLFQMFIYVTSSVYICDVICLYFYICDIIWENPGYGGAKSAFLDKPFSDVYSHILFWTDAHLWQKVYCAYHVLVQPNFRRYYFYFSPDQAQTHLDHFNVLDELCGEISTGFDRRWRLSP